MITAVTTIFGLLVASLLLMLVRRDHLHISHGAGWSVAIALSAPQGSRLYFRCPGSAIGVAYAPILAVTIAIAALVIKALITDIELTKLRVKHQSWCKSSAGWCRPQRTDSEIGHRRIRLVL